MTKNDSHYTIMVVPSETSRVRRLKVYRKGLRTVLIAAGGVVAVLAIAAAVLLVDYVRLRGVRTEMQVARDEAIEQKLTLDRVSTQLKDLQGQLAELSAFDHRLRVLADLEPDRAANDLGMGGPEPSSIGYSFSDNDRKGLLDRMERDLKGLQTEMANQQGSFSELSVYLSERRSLLASTPSIRPANGWSTSNFGVRTDPFTGRNEFHKGMDIAGRLGTPIVATADGMVVFAGVDGALGNSVVVDHGYGYKTIYGHNARVLVATGQQVRRGQAIALMGNTGRTTGTHVHYEVSKNGIPVNPKKYILN
jgi:murein DD-endopeptidase MepM/ murein hydrolase activator NlpD